MHPHRAWAEIDLDAFGRNLARIRQRAGRGVRVLLVVKADAYGLGASLLAPEALACGVSALGVGTGAEGLELRALGISCPIVVLGAVIESEARECLQAGIELGLSCAAECRDFGRLAQELGTKARVHLNLDTGMGRLGTPLANGWALLREVAGHGNLLLAGLMTHVADVAGWSETTRAGLDAFAEFVQQARDRVGFRGFVHAMNSATLFTAPRLYGDTVRPGISALGVMDHSIEGAREFEPVLSFHTQVVALKEVARGTPIGYASEWRAPYQACIATIPVGYADGVPWNLSPGGQVLIRGRRAPIVGRVSMDYVTVDATHIPGIERSDKVTLIGRQGDEELRIQDLARVARTIPYETMCHLGQRVARVVRPRDPIVPAQAPRPRVVPEAIRGAVPDEQRIPGSF